MKKPTSLRPAEGKLGVLLPGMGAVATTTIAGVLLARQGKAVPVTGRSASGPTSGRRRSPTSSPWRT